MKLYKVLLLDVNGKLLAPVVYTLYKREYKYNNKAWHPRIDNLIDCSSGYHATTNPDKWVQWCIDRESGNIKVFCCELKDYTKVPSYYLEGDKYVGKNIRLLYEVRKGTDGKWRKVRSK